MTQNQDLPEGQVSEETSATPDVIATEAAGEAQVGSTEANVPAKTASRITPIRIAIGIAALAAIWTVHREVKAAIEVPEVSFNIIEIVTDIDASIAEAGIGNMLIPLTHGDGKIDIIYAGAPECSYCQGFVQGGEDYPFVDIDELTGFADQQGLDLVYMPLAMSNLGAAIAALDECAALVSSLTKLDMVKTSYALTADLNAVSTNAKEAMESGKPAEEIQEIFKSGLADAFVKIAPGETFSEDCYVESGSSVMQRMNAFQVSFGSHGTPTFFFTRTPGVVEQFLSAQGLEQMMKLLKDK
jgi:hypothetical protein